MKVTYQQAQLENMTLSQLQNIAEGFGINVRSEHFNGVDIDEITDILTEDILCTQLQNLK